MSKKEKIKYLSLSAVFYFIVPLIVLLYKFDFFKKDTSNKVRFTCLGLFVLLVLIIRFNSWVNKIIKSIANVTWQKVLVTGKDLIIIIGSIIALQSLKNSVADLQFLVAVIGGSMLIGNWFMYDFKNAIKKEEKQKDLDEHTNAFYNAMKKVQEEQQNGNQQ